MNDQPQQIADRLAILEVLATYSHAWDARDADAYATLFTDDVRFDVYVPTREDPVIRHDGRKALHSWATRRCAERADEPQSRHNISGTLFDELTADRARTRTMLLETRRDPRESAPTPYATGVYHDEWRKTPDGWRFAKRVLHLD